MRIFYEMRYPSSNFFRFVPNEFSRVIARTSLVTWTDVRIDSRQTDGHTDRWTQTTTIPQRPYGRGVKTMGCPNFNFSLAKLPLKLWYGQEITCHDFMWTIIYPWHWISAGLANYVQYDGCLFCYGWCQGKTLLQEGKIHGAAHVWCDFIQSA